MIFGEKFKENIKKVRYQQGQRLANQGLLKAVGQVTGIDTATQPGMLIVRQKPAKDITEAELDEYPLMADDARAVFFDEFDKYGTVVALQYLLPNNKEAALSATPLCYAALRLDVDEYSHVSTAQTTNAISMRQAKLVLGLAKTLNHMNETSNSYFRLNAELVLDEPFVTNEGYWLI
jgi:hypothetical protein